MGEDPDAASGCLALGLPEAWGPSQGRRGQAVGNLRDKWGLKRMSEAGGDSKGRLGDADGVSE